MKKDIILDEEKTNKETNPTVDGAEEKESKNVLDTNHEQKPGSKKKLFVGLSAGMVLLVVIISVIVTTVLMNQNKEQEDASIIDEDSEEEEKEDEKPTENTVLTSGSVTVEVGGRSITYNGAYVVDGIHATIVSGEYASVADDQAVFLVVNGGSLTINGDVAITKTGSENFQGRGDNYSFYGLNSAVVVVGEGSSVTMKGAKIATDASGANAVVATGGGKATVKNVEIATTKDGSRGLHATFGGAIIAEDTTIATKGGSSASLATDRGEGTVTANRMKLSTEGAGSPLIYSTGEIKVTKSEGQATGAQIAVVEGKNSITLEDCEFSTNGNGNRNGVDNAGIMIYQSMSGDASEGTGSFVAEDCEFTILDSSSVYETTPMFFVTNTTATIKLVDVEANFYDEGYFLLATGTEEWGRSGSNGGIVTLETSNLKATNTNLGVDDISDVTSI